MKRESQLRNLRDIAKLVLDGVKSENRVRQDVAAGECKVFGLEYDSCASFDDVSLVLYRNGKEYHRRGREFHTQEFICYLDRITAGDCAGESTHEAIPRSSCNASSPLLGHIFVSRFGQKVGDLL